MAMFDTLSASRRLREVGFEDEQADAVVGLLAGDVSESVATKSDIELLRADTKSGIDLLKADTKTDIERLRADTKSAIERLGADTKSDIERLRADTKTDIELLRADTKTDIELLRAELRAVEQRMTIRLGGVVAVATGIIIAVMALTG